MITHRLSVGIIGLGLILSSASARGAGFGIAEQGAKAMGLSGAYTAIADDPSAIFFNPAGIGNLEGLQLSAGLTMIAPTATYRGLVPGSATEADVGATKHIFWLPNLHATYRIHEKFAAGVSFYVPYGLTQEWSDTVTIDGVERSWWGRGIIRKISLETAYFNPTVATQLHPRISLGVGLTIAKGAVRLQRAVTLSNDLGDDIDVDLSAGAWGFGATAGILVKVIPELLNAGLSFRSGVKFDFEGNAAFTKDGSPDNIPAGLRTRLTDGAARTSLSLPHVFSFGVAAFPVKPLTLGFNADVNTWSSYDQLAINFVDNPELSSAEPKEWRNTITIRLGAEYRVLPVLPVRAGFIYDQGPAPAATMGPELPDADRYEFTLGVGYEWKGLSVDLAYQFLTTGDIKPAESAPLTGTYNASAHLVGLSLGYKNLDL